MNKKHYFIIILLPLEVFIGQGMGLVSQETLNAITTIHGFFLGLTGFLAYFQDFD